MNRLHVGVNLVMQTGIGGDLFKMLLIIDRGTHHFAGIGHGAQQPHPGKRDSRHLSGGAVQESEQVACETVCELANMVIGNSVTLLNDQGFRFKVFPPEIHANEQGLSGGADTEAMVICIETQCGAVYLNIAMHYLHRRRRERDATAVMD